VIIRETSDVRREKILTFVVSRLTKEHHNFFNSIPVSNNIMLVFKKISEGILFGGIIFLLFILIVQHSVNIPPWLQVVGRMHPLFLHFPIVLLLMSFFSFWLPPRIEHNEIWNIVRLIAALSAVITAIMGLLLSIGDNRSGDVLEWHKWGGISVAIVGFLFYSFHSFFESRKIIGKSFTIIAAAGLTLTGHFGADLTHGDDYLLAPIEQKKKVVPLDQAIVFGDVIKPILEKKCFGCHGEATIKGGLSLADSIGLMKGGKTGPLFIPGQAALSLMIKRIHLPEDEKKHMPPKSKPQLTDEEMALLYAWIQSGGVINQKLISMPARDSFRMLASQYLSPNENSIDEPAYDFAAADEDKIKSLNNNYRVIEPQGINSPALAVHFYGKNNYSSKSLEDLLAVKQQITELSLARMPVKDDEIKLIQQMPNLEKLNLNYTEVTDKGIAQLSALKKLQEIALSGTAVTQNVLIKLLPLPQLNSVFVWNTKIDSTEAASLHNKFKKVKIETGFVDNGQIMIALSPPIIQTPTGVFDKSEQVEMKHPFKGAEIRYTLDGSKPDSVNSTVYKEPINISNDITLNARAFKKGWYGSEPAQAIYVKKGYKPDSIELITQPDPKYKLTKPDLLSDNELGDVNFGNGGWLGYKKNDAIFYLYFNKAVTVEHVLLNMLKSTDQYVFPPVKLEVSGGMDKQHMKLLGTLTPQMPKQNEPPVLIQPQIKFHATEVKYMKIVAQPIKSLPSWHEAKGERGWVFISEIVVN
jgi:hypothetical protein